MSKKLMNEQLPDPTLAKQRDGSARERVVRHMKKLVQIGAASAALSACPPAGPPFGVVDPLPPPARCKTMNDVLSELTATVLMSDAGGLVVLIIDAKTDYMSGVELSTAGATIGGSIRSVDVDRAAETNTMRVVIAPTANTVTVTLTVTCDGELRPITATIDVNALTVTLTDPSRDGG